jgi:uncharacterized surface protein with fasciclin (FAS1) repeats
MNLGYKLSLEIFIPSRKAILTLLFMLLIQPFFIQCRKDDLKEDKYTRQDWLTGKLYTQIKTQAELTTFTQLIEISGYDSIIDKSGCYTIFAPTNEAFTRYFEENMLYNSVEDIPVTEAEKIVKFHLIQDPWSKRQLVSLDIYGWIDTLDLQNNKPKGFKRETLLLNKNMKFGIVYSEYEKENSEQKRTDLVDTTLSDWHRIVLTDSRKYAPLFFKDYFDIYDLSLSDYSFYWGRQFESPDDIYYCNGRILGNEIFAENGFIYIIDQVVEPLINANELLSNKEGPQQYSSLYNLINQFSEMEYDEEETNKQPGADQGAKVDSLFNLTYPQLVFDINNEKTKPPKGALGLPSNVTIRYHHGIVAPTDEAFDRLINEYLVGGNKWGSLENAPENIKRIIANSCLSSNSIYPSDFEKGFVNGESDNIRIDESTIVQKQFASNCTFIGINEPIIPRAFSSVTGPIYTQKGYSKVMIAIENSGLLSALKRDDANYSLFVESDISSSIDSSFIYDPVAEQFYAITLYPAVRSTALTVDDLRTLIMSHVATDQPRHIARKEFIPNLVGNYIIFDNVTNEVKGTAATTYGYHGVDEVTVIPKKISTNSDNGTTYEISNWFNFSATDAFIAISTKYPKFHNLIQKAGLSQDRLYKYTFMSDNQRYTIFVPSDSAVMANNFNTLSQKELQNLVLTHFVQGVLIFTDGKEPEGFYETARIDESSTPYVTINSKIKVVPGIDMITIPYKDSSKSIVINESTVTNLITSKNLNKTGKEAYINSVSNGVIHEIKEVLLYDQILTK